MLRNAGFARVLVEMGEIRALDDERRPWRVGLKDPEAPERISGVLPLADCALTTSAGYGTRFDTAGRHHHLFDSASGTSADTCLSVSVTAPRATTADALATALAVAVRRTRLFFVLPR